MYIGEILQMLFEIFDQDGNGAVDFSELQAGSQFSAEAAVTTRLRQHFLFTTTMVMVSFRWRR